MFLSMFMLHIIGVCVCEGVFVCVFVCVFVFVCINAGMPDCPASDQFGTGIKKLTMLGQFRYGTKPKADRHFFCPGPD